jgi:hypothetical protein
MVETPDIQASHAAKVFQQVWNKHRQNLAVEALMLVLYTSHFSCGCFHADLADAFL